MKNFCVLVVLCWSCWISNSYAMEKSNTKDRVSRARRSGFSIKSLPGKNRIACSYLWNRMFHSIKIKTVKVLYRKALARVEKEMGFKLKRIPKLAFNKTEQSFILARYTADDHGITVLPLSFHILRATLQINSRDMQNAFFLVLCHEITHAYQHEMGIDRAPTRWQEAHACLLQDQIAMKDNIYNVQLLGEKFFFNLKKVILHYGPRTPRESAQQQEDFFTQQYGQYTDKLYQVFDQGKSTRDAHAKVWKFLRTKIRRG